MGVSARRIDMVELHTWQVRGAYGEEMVWCLGFGVVLRGDTVSILRPQAKNKGSS